MSPLPFKPAHDIGHVFGQRLQAVHEIRDVVDRQGKHIKVVGAAYVAERRQNLPRPFVAFLVDADHHVPVEHGGPLQSHVET